jgi:hypothetical protein
VPIGTCDPASRGDAYNQVAEEVPLPNGSGSVLIDGRWDWDGVSVRPNCDGPVNFLRTRNTGTMPAWANLPNKKRGNPWVQIDPGTDVTIVAKGTLANLGLSNYTDLLAVGFQFTDPAV